jgi:REP element-mobilizing transposase RayT
MLYENLPRHPDLKAAGWHSRGYLPHFDGREVPQFITCWLFDSVPKTVIEKWMRELALPNSGYDQIALQKRLERYLDQGFGEAHLKNPQIAQLVQDDLLSYDGVSWRLSAWVVMPNHIHLLATRFEAVTLSAIVQSFKSLTSHKANRVLSRKGRFWMPEYFDRYIRNPQHSVKTISYIENNPVKAMLCEKPENWPFSSARFRKPV